MCFQGAIFDKDSILSHTAFRYEVERHNNSSATVKLEKYEKDANILGNFELSKASEYKSISCHGNYGYFETGQFINIVTSLVRNLNIPFCDIILAGIYSA